MKDKKKTITELTLTELSKKKVRHQSNCPIPQKYGTG